MKGNKSDTVKTSSVIKLIEQLRQVGDDLEYWNGKNFFRTSSAVITMMDEDYKILKQYTDPNIPRTVLDEIVKNQFINE